MLTLGANISSLRLVRQLDQSSSGLSRSYERLSTGARINRASDDSAGLSVSFSLNAKSRVLGRASQNVSDGLSLLSIADSALDASSSLLGRLAELAEQAANGSYSSTQRAALDREFQQLDRELRRIEASTQFNGLNLLRGEKSANAFKIISTDPSATSTDAVALSKNGKYAVYVDSGGTYTISDLETGSKKIIDVEAAGLSGVSISTAGFQVLDNGDMYFGGSAVINASSRSNIYSISYASGQGRQITDSQVFLDSGTTFTVSADGSTLAFVSSTSYTDGAGISSAAVGDSSFYMYVFEFEYRSN